MENKNLSISGVNLIGKVVLIRKSCLNESWHDDNKRAFFVIGGFGANPTSIGTTIVGEFLIDGEQCRQTRSRVERLASDEEVKSWGYLNRIEELSKEVNN